MLQQRALVVLAVLVLASSVVGETGSGSGSMGGSSGCVEELVNAPGQCKQHGWFSRQPRGTIQWPGECPLGTCDEWAIGPAGTKIRIIFENFAIQDGATADRLTLCDEYRCVNQFHDRKYFPNIFAPDYDPSSGVPEPDEALVMTGPVYVRIDIGSTAAELDSDALVLHWVPDCTENGCAGKCFHDNIGDNTCHSLLSCPLGPDGKCLLGNFPEENMNIPCGGGVCYCPAGTSFCEEESELTTTPEPTKEEPEPTTTPEPEVSNCTENGCAGQCFHDNIGDNTCHSLLSCPLGPDGKCLLGNFPEENMNIPCGGGVCYCPAGTSLCTSEAEEAEPMTTAVIEEEEGGPQCTEEIGNWGNCHQDHLCCANRNNGWFCHRQSEWYSQCEPGDAHAVEARLALSGEEACESEETLRELCEERLQSAVVPHASSIVAVQCVSVRVENADCSGSRRADAQPELVADAFIALEVAPAAFLDLGAVVASGAILSVKEAPRAEEAEEEDEEEEEAALQCTEEIDNWGNCHQDYQCCANRNNGWFCHRQSEWYSQCEPSTANARSTEDLTAGAQIGSETAPSSSASSGVAEGLAAGAAALFAIVGAAIVVRRRRAAAANNSPALPSMCSFKAECVFPQGELPPGSREPYTVEVAEIFGSELKADVVFARYNAASGARRRSSVATLA